MLYLADLTLEYAIDKCLEKPNYSVVIGVYGEEDVIRTSDFINQNISIRRKIQGINNVFVINRLFVSSGVKTKKEIIFSNGSCINLITKENMISEICSQVIFMDSRIRETYIQEVIKPKIDQYVLGDGNAIFNPKPIYLQFV